MLGDDDEVVGDVVVVVPPVPGSGSSGISGSEPLPPSAPEMLSTMPPTTSPMLPPGSEMSIGDSAAAIPAEEIMPAAINPTSALTARRRPFAMSRPDSFVPT